MNLQPVMQRDGCELFQGDSLALLREFPDATFDAVVTDPPYSSGGFTRGDRMASAVNKYQMTSSGAAHVGFSGDNRDQRGFLAWCSLWMAECWRVTKPGGIFLCFTDWRQLPTVTDAVQAGNWLWRGIVPWDKTEATRPQKGWFRAQAEYVVACTSGSLGPEQERAGPCLPGVFRCAVNSETKHHLTGKPVRLLRELLGVVPPGGRVLDPFAGGGSTLLAARELGMPCTGVELNPDNIEIIRDRFLQAVMPMPASSPSSSRPPQPPCNPLSDPGKP